jgi:hypothetical protein
MKVPPGWDIPVDIRIHLSDRSGRQREVVADGHIVMMLHKLPKPKSRTREPAFFWRCPSGEWRTTERGQPRPVLQQLIDEYEEAVETLGEQHGHATTAIQRFEILERIGPISRAIRNLTDTICKGRDVLEDHDAKQDLAGFCDHAQDVVRSSDAQNAVDFHIARQAEIQAAHSQEVERATHRLNSMATIFLPLTAVASLFGMNLSSGLESAPPWLFWIIMLGSVVAGFLVSEVNVAMKLRSRSK